MNKSGIPSPARSQGAPMTPRRYNPRRSRSVGSPARSITSGRPTTAVDHFKEHNRISFRLSPLCKTILNDNTDIEEPRRNSWWKKIDTSQDISSTVGVLEEGTNREKGMETNILNDEFDIEILSQERKDYTFDLPESSGSESIGSIVIPHRKLLNCNENEKQPKCSQATDRLQQSIDLPENSASESIDSIIIPQRKLLNNNHKDNQPKDPKPKNMLHQFTSKRESPGKHNKTDTHDKTIHVNAKKLFNQEPKRTKPAFPAALLMISPDKTVANKTKELATEVKGQARNLFGNRPAIKRKNMFADFIVSESEDEISDVQPKLLTFNKVPEPIHQRGSTSRGLRDLSISSSNTTDLEMEEWNLLPSSTMLDHRIESMVLMTPGKRVRLSTRLSKVSEAGAKSNITDNKSKPFNKSISYKEKSNSLPDHITKEEGKSPEKEQMGTNTANQNSTPYQSKANSSQMKNTSQKNVTNIEKITKDDGKIINVDNQTSVEIEVTNRQAEQVHKSHNMAVNKITSEAGEDLDEDEDFVLAYDENEQPDGAYQENLQKSNENNPVEGNSVMKRKDEMHEIVGEQENAITSDEVEKTPMSEKSRHDVNKVIEETDEEIENAQVVKEKMYDKSIKENLKQKLETSAKGINEEMQAKKDKEEEIEDQNKEAKGSDNHEEAIESDEETNQLDQGIQNMQAEKIEQSDEKQVEEQETEEEIEDEEMEEEDDNEVQSEHEDKEIEENQDDTMNETEEEQDDEASLEIDQETPNESEEDLQNEEDEETEDHEESEEILDEEDVENGNQEEQDDSESKHEQDEEIEEPQQMSEAEEETPNKSHDTTGRNRKRDTKSPEAILHDVTNQNESFIAKGRNSSIRKTTILKNFFIRPSMAPEPAPRDSTGFSDGTKNSSAEGSGWDSHRTTRKTLRQTFGKDFTPRKSLRALVMEKSARRQTAINEAIAKLNLPEANSTELPENGHQDEEMDYEEMVQESDHEVSRRTRQTTLEMYLQKVKKETIEYKLKIDEQVKNSLKCQPLSTDSMLNQRAIRRTNTNPQQTAMKPKKTKRRTNIPIENLPHEFLEDLKYKPPKRFKGRNASWISKRLYRFLESKLEPKYDYKARVRSEKLVETLYEFTRDIRKLQIAPAHAVAKLKHEMARLQIVRSHFEFYEFVRDYLPLEIKVKIVPDIVNDIPLPPNGVFADILTGKVV